MQALEDVEEWLQASQYQHEERPTFVQDAEAICEHSDLVE